MPVELVNPESLGAPIGYSHAAVGRGRYVALAGMIGWDKSLQLVSDDFVAQFDQALSNVVAALAAAGGRPTDIASLRIYVVDKHVYNVKRKLVGESYRKHMGKHFPPMALLQVAGLLEPGALVEIEGVAFVGDE